MTDYTDIVKALREKAKSLYNASRLYDEDAREAAILFKAAYAIEELSKRIGNAVEYDYAEIVRELRQDASTSWDLYLADAIEALNVECKEWKERGDALEKTLNVAFSDFAKIEKNQPWINVKDALPEYECDVLAFCVNGEETRIAPCTYKPGDDFYDCIFNCYAKGVTHWMGMPGPPKEET